MAVSTRWWQPDWKRRCARQAIWGRNARVRSLRGVVALGYQARVRDAETQTAAAMSFGPGLRAFSVHDNAYLPQMAENRSQNSCAELTCGLSLNLLVSTL